MQPPRRAHETPPTEASNKLTALITNLESKMGPVKKTRLGNSHFAVEKGHLKVVERTEGCWNNFVECITRLFCATFGIKRELQNCFEQITNQLKEAIELSKKDDIGEAQTAYETFVKEFTPVIQDMFLAGVKIDKISSSCLGKKAFSMNCLTSASGRQVQNAFNAYVRTAAQAKETAIFKRIEQNLRHFALQMSGSSTISGCITIENQQFFLTQPSGDTLFSTQEELTEAVDHLLADVCKYLQMTFSTDVPNNISFYGVYGSEEEAGGFTIVMDNGDSKRSGDLHTYQKVNDVLEHYNTIKQYHLFDTLEHTDRGWAFPRPKRSS